MKWIFVACLSTLVFLFSVEFAFAQGCVPGRIGKYSFSFQTYKTGYYPDGSSMEGGYTDRKGRPLQTLQSYLRGRTSYVSVSMDKFDGRFPYGTMLRIPDLERAYGRCIVFRVVDTGGNFEGQGSRKMDICHDSEGDTIQPIHNGWSTVFVVQ